MSKSGFRILIKLSFGSLFILGFFVPASIDYVIGAGIEGFLPGLLTFPFFFLHGWLMLIAGLAVLFYDKLKGFKRISLSKLVLVLSVFNISFYFFQFLVLPRNIYAFMFNAYFEYKYGIDLQGVPRRGLYIDSEAIGLLSGYHWLFLLFSIVSSLGWVLVPLVRSKVKLLTRLRK